MGREAEVSKLENCMTLPELPEPSCYFGAGEIFDAHQMTAYGIACINAQKKQDADVACIEASIRADIEGTVREIERATCAEIAIIEADVRTK